MNEVEGLYNKIKDIYSDGIDILVHNVGSAPGGITENIGIVIWEKMLRINLTSAFYLTSLSLPGMKIKEHGHKKPKSFWKSTGRQ
ncbi:D-beta-hydroxybutyrate dehydrogenase-like [Saccoglossus kowalevskii]